MNKVVLTEKRINSVNQSKKRPLNLPEWKCVQAKRNKNSGLPYTSKNGSQNPGIPAPPGEKACGPNCFKPYCLLDAARQEQIQEDFLGSGDYAVQTALLFSMVRKGHPVRKTVGANSRRKASYKYYFPDDEGIMQEVCKVTFKEVLGITDDRIKMLHERISTGRLLVQDGRGSHENRPHTVPANVRQEIIDHINSYPSELSHYTRNHGNPERRYLDKELTIRKMFAQYNAVVGPEGDSRFWLYCQEFRRTNLIIGHPRSDTCPTCDRLFVKMCSTNIPAEIDELDLESILHHVDSESGFESLREDILKNIQNPNVETFTFDLQQVLFTPVLTNSEYFYKRKYSCYNFAITSPKETNKSYMHFWHESIGKRGSDEIASCILKLIETKYLPLLPGNQRILITYSDRCGGQNCNWTIFCLLRLLVYRGYFTEVIHKFMTSGHSFLPCDREFAVIERQKKTSNVYLPEDWARVIKEAKVSNEVTQMTQQDFFSFDAIKHLFHQPHTLKVTEVMEVKFTRARPDVIFTKIGHDDNTRWDEHVADYRLDVYQQPIQLLQKYHYPIDISQDKKADLLSMCDFLLPQYRAFYQNL